MPFQSVDMTIYHKIPQQILPAMRRPELVATNIPCNKFSSFFDAKVASQPSSDDLTNIGQVLVKHNSLDIFPAIKLILSWDVFFWSASPEFKKRKKGVRNKFLSRLVPKYSECIPQLS